MKLTPQAIAFHATGLILAAGTLTFVVRGLFISEVIEPCSTRYDEVTEFTVDYGKGPLSPAQLVAMIGANQRGVSQYAKVVRVKGTASPHALRIALHQGGETRKVPEENNGIGFKWAPRDMGGAEAACLAYSIYLPKNFDFGGGGILPGLFAGKPLKLSDTADGKTAVAQRVVWRSGGGGNIYAQLPGYDVNGGTYLDQKGIEVGKGRWVKVEQEMVLNTPGTSDGLSRIWVDGELKIDKRWLEWRKHDQLKIEGVLHDIGYAMPRRAVHPPKNTVVYITPMELRWR
ncbi:MAG: polysaccharide lyase [Alphaproteobacteria bacterium]|nr:polysaccharide lyase [Alphaproteobacteria bacterium]